MATWKQVTDALKPGDRVFKIGGKESAVIEEFDHGYKCVVTDKDIIFPEEFGQTWFCFQSSAVMKGRCE